MNPTQHKTLSTPFRHVAAVLIGLGAAVLPGSLPASAQTIYDVDVANRISGLSPEVRAQLRNITKASRTQMMAVLAKYGIDPDAKPDLDKLMPAADALQAVSRAQREAALKILKPEEMAQYDTMVSEKTQKIKDAAN